MKKINTSVGKIIKTTLILFLTLVSLPYSAEAKVSSPKNVVASACDGKVVLTFDPATTTAGEKIIKYVAFTYGNDSDLHGFFYEASNSTSPIEVKVPNNQDYSFQVYAVGYGYTYGPNSSFTKYVRPKEGLTCGISSGSTQVLYPSAPTNVVATPSNGSVKLSFTPPKPVSSSAGSQIKFYSVQTTPDTGEFISGTESPITVTGLENGKSYQFEIKAQDSDGFWGPYSIITKAVTPKDTSTLNPLYPGVPTDVKIEKGSYGSAVISFTPPAPVSASAGSQINYYTVRVTPDIGSFPSGSTSPVIASGLENGKSYQFEIRAVDKDGFIGPYSKISSPLSFKWDGASLVPGTPTNVVAKPDDMSVTLTFTEPAPASSSAGSKIKFYSVKITPDGSTFASGPGSPIKIVGLENGKSYQFEVRAQDSDGFWGPYSAITKAVKPNGPTTLYPDAVLNVQATAGDKEALVSFNPLTPKTSSPGSKIRFYSIRSTPEGVYASNSTSPIRVTGLENGKTYTFTVKAQDMDGFWGPESNSSNPVTPTGTPTAPQNVTTRAGDSGISVYWQPPANNGGFPILSYTVELLTEGELNGWKHTTSKGTSLYVSNLENGKTYKFRVVATNKIGDGPYAESKDTEPSADSVITDHGTGDEVGAGTDDDTGKNPSEINKYFQIKNPLKSASMEEFIARILDALVLLLTPILVIALIISGFLFVKARGNPEELSSAKRILMYTLVGAAIILGAKAIATILTNTLNQF